MRDLLPEISQTKVRRPTLDIGVVTACGDEVFDIVQLHVRMRVLCPKKLGENQVFLADDPGFEILDFDPLSTSEFMQAILASFANNTIHLNNTCVMYEVEH